MTENKNLVAALTRRLGEKEKENAEFEEHYSALLDEYESLEKQLYEEYELSKIGECIANNEHPILITGVEIGDADFCVLSQGMVYSLFYGGLSTREMLYFAPKAYYPAERLLECYFVIGTKGKAPNELFIPECVHGLQYYNSLEALFPNWAQSRVCMLPLDFDNMFVVDFLLNIEFDNVKTMVKQVNPKYQLLKEIIPNLRGGLRVRLALPDYEHLKKKHSKKTKH